VIATETRPDSTPLTRFAWLSLATAIATIFLKTVAYLATGSVGLLSDAVESIVNLVGAGMALAMLTIAARPPDDDHAYGHEKAEDFSSGVEGGLIVVAAFSIGFAAVRRLLEPQPLERVGFGLAVSVGASLLNLGTALLLLRVARRRHSITLEANARHLLTDVWTSAGVLVGVGAVVVTGWQQLDPLVALIVAANIVWTGVGIVWRSVRGLMDVALPEAERVTIRRLLEGFCRDGVEFHALLTRQSGTRRFASVHILVPPDWTVARGHQLVEEIEAAIRNELPNTSVLTHLEPQGDPASWLDVTLDRQDAGAPTPQR
jgi:cation diffusion facilitator family transporter